MSSRTQKRIAELARHPRELFLLDAIGALSTAFLIGVVLTRFESWIGLPRSILYSLAGIAITFSLYSFTCSRFELKAPRLALGLIILGNSFYCALTLSLLILFREDLTVWAYLYFLGEIAVILTLIALECAVFRKLR